MKSQLIADYLKILLIANQVLLILLKVVFGWRTGWGVIFIPAWILAALVILCCILNIADLLKK